MHAITRHSGMVLIIAAGIVLALATRFANGDTLLVPSQYPTIQAGIDAAQNLDTVLVADGVYTGTGNKDLDFGGKLITVRSENGPANCIIDCEASEADPHRGFYFHSGEGPTAVVQGFTITQGYLYRQYGAGMLIEDSSPTVIDCVLSDNFIRGESDGGGAGIAILDGDPLIQGCAFNRNSTDNYYSVPGGGLLNSGGSPTLIDCSFTDNYAGKGGGGIVSYSSNSHLELIDCTFTNNESRWGGAVATHDAALTGCTFTGNVENDFGGAALYQFEGDIILTDCTFTGNRADGEGGSVHSYRGTLRANNCQFVANESDSGAGLTTTYGTVTLANCAYLANEGSGVHVYLGQVTATNCTFSANNDNRAGAVETQYSGAAVLSNCILWGDTPAEVYGPNITITYSDVQGGYAGTGNIAEDPLFADPGNNNFRLTAPSSCINTGDPNFVPQPGERDLDGHARVLCGRVDMGAYEFGIGDGDCDRDVDLDDYALYLDCVTGPGGGLLPGCEAFDFDGDEDVDFADLGGFQMAFTGSP